MKRDAQKLQTEQAKAARKQESERKKEAKAITKKVITLSSKLAAPLASALHKAREVMSKAVNGGVDCEEAFNDFKNDIETLEDWKKKTANAVATYSKNPASELTALPFENEKEANNFMKSVQREGNRLVKEFLTTSKKK